MVRLKTIVYVNVFEDVVVVVDVFKDVVVVIDAFEDVIVVVDVFEDVIVVVVGKPPRMVLWAPLSPSFLLLSNLAFNVCGLLRDVRSA